MYLKRICSLGGISGFEHTSNESLADIFKEKLTDVSTDVCGNTEGWLFCGKENAPVIMLEAHFDVIGLMIKEVHDDGFLSFITVGGVDPRILPGMELTVHGKEDIYGVIGLKPPHVLSSAEMKKTAKADELVIDTGLSGEKLKTLVRPGDAVTFRREHTLLGESKFCGSGLDDRAGIAAIFDAAQLISETDRNADVCVLASTTEETGRFGVKCAAGRINPDLAIIVDVTHGTTPDGIKNRSSELGKGPVLCFGPNLDRKYTRLMKQAMEENEIPFSVEVEPDDPGTNAWAVQTVNEGIPCVMLSIPLRYMHTNIETLSLEDLKNTAEAIAAFVKNFAKGDINA